MPPTTANAFPSNFDELLGEVVSSPIEVRIELMHRVLGSFGGTWPAKPHKTISAASLRGKYRGQALTSDEFNAEKRLEPF